MATKAEMINEVAESAGVSKTDAEATVGAFFDYVVRETMKGGKVSVPGFGAFSTTQRSARMGRNPQTGKEITIAAKNVVKFKPGAELNEKVK